MKQEKTRIVQVFQQKPWHTHRETKNLLRAQLCKNLAQTEPC